MPHLKRTLIAASAFAAATVVMAGAAQAQVEFDTRKAVNFTFNQPITLPNLTLPAGSYVFQLTSGPNARDVIVVYNADRTKSMGFLHTVPIERATAPEKPEVRFMEAAAGTPAPIQSYFYPGTKTGWEFVYPREQALQLAKASKTPVMAMTKSGTPEEVTAADLAVVTPEGQQSAYDRNAASVPMATAAQQGEVSERATPAASRQASAATSTRTQLPGTASNTAAVALVGLMTLMLAVSVGVWRRQLGE